jgi:chemotaxis protein methyltransferase CheR
MSLPLSRTAAPASLSSAEFDRVAKIAHREAGLSLSEAKRAMIASRLTRRLRATGLADFAAYLALLESEHGKDERQHLISALTTNVTNFFRENHHFQTLESEILPMLATRAQAGQRVRIWSAGCSTGQEPYSIAMSVLRTVPDAARLDIRILATDIDATVLAVAKNGRYPAQQLEAVDPALKRQFFASAPGGDLEAGDTLRGLISFRHLNLIGPWPVRGPFDVIFCRNVVIYFDAETQASLWPRFHHVLAPGGTLFIGHSERLDPQTTERFLSAGVTTYRKPDDVAGGQAGGAIPWH